MVKTFHPRPYCRGDKSLSTTKVVDYDIG
jgi:hypothetical protein